MASSSGSSFWRERALDRSKPDSSSPFDDGIGDPWGFEFNGAEVRHDALAVAVLPAVVLTIAAKAEALGDQVVGIVSDHFGDLDDRAGVIQLHFDGDADGEFAVEFGQEVGDLLIFEEAAEFRGIAGGDVDEDDVVIIDRFDEVLEVLFIV